MGANHEQSGYQPGGSYCWLSGTSDLMWSERYTPGPTNGRQKNPIGVDASPNGRGTPSEAAMTPVTLNLDERLDTVHAKLPASTSRYAATPICSPRKPPAPWYTMNRRGRLPR